MESEEAMNSSKLRDINNHSVWRLFALVFITLFVPSIFFFFNELSYNDWDISVLVGWLFLASNFLFMIPLLFSVSYHHRAVVGLKLVGVFILILIIELFLAIFLGGGLRDTDGTVIAFGIPYIVIGGLITFFVIWLISKIAHIYTWLRKSK